MTNDRSGIFRVPEIHQCTVEMRGACRSRNLIHRRKQGLNILGIAGVCTGITGRAHPRLPVQGVYCQPAVIGQGWQPSDSGCMASLENGVFDKGYCRLFCFTDTQLALSHGFKAQWPEQIGKFGNFPRVITGNNKLLAHDPLLNSVWAKRTGSSRSCPMGRAVMLKVIRSPERY